jgi:hypothetical protein
MLVYDHVWPPPSASISNVCWEVPAYGDVFQLNVNPGAEQSERPGYCVQGLYWPPVRGTLEMRFDDICGFVLAMSTPSRYASIS